MDTENEANAGTTKAGVPNAIGPDGKAWVSLFGRPVSRGNSDAPSHQKPLSMEAASHSAATSGQPTIQISPDDMTCAQNPHHHEQPLSCDQETQHSQKASTIPLPTPRESHASNEKPPHNDHLPSPEPGHIAGNDGEHEVVSPSEHHIARKRPFEEEEMNNQQQKPDEAEGGDNTAAHEVPPNEPPAKKKRITVIKYPCGKDAREQAAVRQMKKHDRLKEHIRKLMQKQGPDLAAEDVPPPPPIRRRNVKIQASEHDESEDSEDSIDPDASEPEFHDIKAKDRIKEINGRIISGGLTNRRTGSQKADLEEARLIFGKGKVRKVKRRGDVFCQLSGMTVELKEFQLVGAGWMVKRETDEGAFKGGLLADVPGFGKTVMSLAAIAGNPPSPDQIVNDIKATLIVVPNGEILKQWMGQIQQHMEFANRGCFHYKGSQNGNMTAKELSNRKIVLTTYQEVQRAWPSAKRRQELRRDCTTTTTTEDGVTTTEYDEERLGLLCYRESGLLFHVGWYRVIFDEVHSVKNVNSQTCVAAQNLQYTIFWGLSGTPLVNADTEMFPYLRLINWTDVETLADYREKYLKDVNGRDRIDALVSLLTFRR